LKNFNKNIIKQCILALLIGSPSPALAGDQTIKIGLGYKHFEASTHNNTIHSGKDLSIGYGYSYGEKMLNHFQFQVSNSSKEVKYELPYVSANSNINLSQEFNFPFFTKGKLTNHTGIYFANNFSLNFFPQIDRNNFTWENQLIAGLSTRNSYKLTDKKSIALNIQIPIYSLFLSHRLHRLTGDLPQSNLSLWNAMDKQTGLANKLFMPNLEIGYQINIVASIKAGIFYQANCNWYQRENGYRINSKAHIISLRITY
tara:strand:+ start:610 stop:1380 length:771 start_codon:yes stop_codon:yes gene_type:complete